MLANHPIAAPLPAWAQRPATGNRIDDAHSVPDAEGSAGLYSLFDAAFCPMDYRLGTDSYPWGVVGFEQVSLPGIDLFRDSGFGRRRAVRTRRHIIENPGNDFVVSIPLETRVSISQMGVSTTCDPGSFIIFSTARPYSAEICALRPNEPFTQLLGKISGALMRPLLPALDECSPRPIRLQAGTGSVMRGLFDLLLAEGNHLPTDQAAEFADLLIHLIAAAVREAPESNLPQATTSASARMREAARDYIQRNLSDPDLDTRAVAAHCKVSERYLHAIFSASAVRVGAYIRAARLEQCRAALRDPALQYRAIEEIAIHWGFRDPGSFSRAYKARYGIAPREERKAAERLVGA